MKNHFAALVIGFAGLAGCSDDAPEPPKPDEETPAAVPAGKASAATANDETVAIRRPKLPDDVFFEDPLAIANNKTRVRGADPIPGPTPVTPSGETPAEPPTGDAAEEAVDWASLLPADLLTAEATAIRERFQPKLTSVANFNNSLLEVPPYAAELAALGAIAVEHPGDIPWKRNAKYVRDLSAAMTSEQLQRGQKSYDQVKEPFAKVVEILDGKTPAELPDSADENDFSAADFGGVMKRFEAGQNTVQQTAGSEPAFKQNAAALAREARVLAALSKVVATDDHGYGDDAKFQEYAAAMTKAALDAAAGAEAGDFAKFGAGFNALGQSCTQCHGEYRNN